MKIVPPWSLEQVLWLNQFQNTGSFHPFTCGENSNHRPLVAGPNGWVCIDCGYSQAWAHDFMADPKIIRSQQKLLRKLRSKIKAEKE